MPGPDTTLTVIADNGVDGAALDTLARHGYLLARVDSTARDTVFVVWGPPARVRSVRVVGAASQAGLGRDWRTRPGAVYTPAGLGADLQNAADAYARSGFLDASLVASAEGVDGGRGVEVVVRVDEGAARRVAGVELAGGRGPARGFASRRTGVEAGAEARSLDLGRVRADLEATGLYLNVGDPVLALDGTGDLVVQVPVVEAPPGVFDVVVGYLPPQNGARGGVVGSGRVDLRNPFGGGRTASVALDRTPGLGSALSIAVADPFVLGTAFGLGLGFEGVAQDSTLSRQRVAAEVRYGVARGLDVVGTLAGEAVRPGTFGAEPVDGVPRVRRRDDLLIGAGIAFARLDRPANPRRGVTLSVLAEQGRRSGDLVTGRSVRRLTLATRGYFPTLGRQAIAVGVDGTLSQVGGTALADQGDLLRVGGARSFRGYDEASLVAQSYARALAEYRLLFDAESFAFAFVDVGALERPATPALAAQRRALVGYGAGGRVRTALGLATLTYALTPDLRLGQGKVHLGVRVGL